jgi:hypothetical protein
MAISAGDIKPPAMTNLSTGMRPLSEFLQDEVMAPGRSGLQDSPPEEAGSELSVPHDTTKVLRAPHVASSLISGNQK